MSNLCQFCEQENQDQIILIQSYPENFRSRPVTLFDMPMCSRCSSVFRSFIIETIGGNNPGQDWERSILPRPRSATLYFVGFVPQVAIITAEERLDALIQDVLQLDQDCLALRIAAALNATQEQIRQGSGRIKKDEIEGVLIGGGSIRLEPEDFFRG